MISFESIFFALVSNFWGKSNNFLLDANKKRYFFCFLA